MSGLSIRPKIASLCSFSNPSKISLGIPLTALSVLGIKISCFCSSVNVSKISLGIPLTALASEISASPITFSVYMPSLKYDNN